MQTVPVLVDGERVIFESTAICHYLDRKVPLPPLWPAGLAGAEAIEVCALTDAIINTLSTLGMRCSALHQDSNFPAVREHMVGRVQRTLDLLAEKAAARSSGGAALCGDGWSGADMAVYTMVTWLEGLPVRAATYPAIRGVVDLGWSLPAPLRSWATLHRERSEVLALD
jgi:glutathione S-transferase